MKKRIFIKNTLFIIVGIILSLSALGKFVGRESLQTLFASVSMEAFIIRIGVVQLIIVACLMYKPLRSLGVLIGSAFLGGAIFMLIATDQNPLSAALTLLMLWTAYKLEWWGYWNHYTENCRCGWCKRSAPVLCNCTDDCSCPKDNCIC